jgi:hypothetical protein
VRPVRASTRRKRMMREELLAHVSDIFDQEAARIGDDGAALPRTALRFGRPEEVTDQLQESVPASDGFRRFWEGRPEESPMRTAVRFAWVTGTLSAITFVILMIAVGWVSVWPREIVIMCLCAVAVLPLCLSMLVFFADWMDKALHGPSGRSWLKVGLIAAGSWLFMLLWGALLTWPTLLAGRDNLSSVLIVGWLGILSPYVLAQSSHQRRKYHEEWARLEIAWGADDPAGFEPRRGYAFADKDTSLFSDPASSPRL